jgi:hypothetical protein
MHKINGLNRTVEKKVLAFFEKLYYYTVQGDEGKE